MSRVLLAAVLASSAASVFASPAVSLDVSDHAAYERAHREMAQALLSEVRSPARLEGLLADLKLHQRELPLREECSRCMPVAERLGMEADYEPSVRLIEPIGAAAKRAAASSELLIAYPPAGNDRHWTAIPALSMSGKWLSLDAHVPPNQPTLVVRINGRLSMEKQLAQANELLRAAGLQNALPNFSQPKGTGHWTTRLDGIWLDNDEEPWISGAAEVYAITSGVLPGNQPQIQVVDMPYLDNEHHTYYPQQIVLDWANYSYGVASVLLYEHDDNTNYKQLVTVLISAVGAGASLAGYPQVTAVTEIANRIVAAMPDDWFTNDDDYVDSFYTIEKTRGSGGRWGAAGNAWISYTPYELPPN